MNDKLKFNKKSNKFYFYFLPTTPKMFLENTYCLFSTQASRWLQDFIYVNYEDSEKLVFIKTKDSFWP